MNTPRIKGQYWSVLVTLSLISLGLIYYLLVHTGKKESELREKAFRDLNRFVDNFQKKYNTYTKNADYIVDLAYERENENADALKKYTHDSILKIRENNITNNSLKFCGIDSAGSNCKLDQQSLLFIGTRKNGNAGYLPGMQFSANIPEFIKPFFKNTLFEDYVFVQKVFKNGDKTNSEVFEYNSVLPNLDANTFDKDSIIGPVVIGEDKFIAFKTSFKTPGNSNVIDFYGLIPNKTYQLSLYKLDIWFVILLVLLLLVLLLSIPIIKLMVLSSIEEISIKDYLLIGLSIYMGASIIFLTLLILTNSINNNKDIDQNLTGIANQLKSNFLENVQKATKQIDYYENTLNINDPVFNKHSLNGSYYVEDILNNPSFEPEFFPAIKLAYWINKKGKQKIVYSIFPEKGNFSDLSHRNYFKQVMDNNFWDLQTPSKRKIVVESIRSTSSGECLAAISSPSKIKQPHGPKDLGVVVATTPIHSLTNASLPHGYEFVIIDNSGDVWFHSNNEFNLQENFLEEVSGNTKLEPIIASRSNQFFKCNYHGKRYRGNTLPIKGTPLQVIALYDKNINSSFLSQVISTSFVFVLLSYGFVFIQALLLLMLLKTTRSKLYTKLSWLKYWDRPDAKKTYAYLLRINSLNILIIILINWLFGQLSGGTSVSGYIATVYASITLFAVNYYYLSDQYASLVQNPFSGKTIMAASVKSKFLLLSTVYLLVSILISLYLHQFTDVLIALVTTILIVLSFQFSRRDKTPDVKNGQLFFLGLYISWIVLLGILPAYYAFKISYNLEHKGFTKEQLCESAKKIIENTDAIEMFYKKIPLKKEEFLENKIAVTFYAHGYQVEELFPYTSIKPKRFDSIYHNVSPGFTGMSMANRCYILDSPGDGSWESVIKNKKMYLKKYAADKKPIILSRGLNSPGLLKFPKNHTGLSVVLLLIVLITFFAAIVIIIRFLTGKLYGIGLVKKYATDIKVDETAIRQTYRFIVGLSGSGKTYIYKSRAQNGGLYINFKKIHDPALWNGMLAGANKIKSGSIVIDNFEYGLKDILLWSRKLDLMNILYRKENINVFVLSQIHPEQLFKVYDYFMNNGTQATTPEGKTVTVNCNAEYFEWQQILDRYTLSYLPLAAENIDSILGLIKEQKDIIRSSWKIGFQQEAKEDIEQLQFFEAPGKLFNIELNNRDESFMVSMDQILEAGGEKQFVPKHQLLYNYYFSVWKSLPIEEKYILFDFAQDGLLNSNNQKAITSLANKGLLVDEGSVALINDSFRYFILDVLQPKEELKQSREILEKGKWNKFRIVLMIVIFTLFALLWIGSKEFIGEIKAILIAATGIATALIRFRNETGNLLGKN